ncbi:MAG: hypothetical protein K0U93_06020, partial [Gammaproteobacteria bacterium]|nr:hypothetical protein [Gammaproteobacteria bacterium]
QSSSPKWALDASNTDALAWIAFGCAGRTPHRVAFAKELLQSVRKASRGTRRAADRVTPKRPPAVSSSRWWILSDNKETYRDDPSVLRFSALRAAADAGNQEAQYIVGLAYLGGWLVGDKQLKPSRIKGLDYITRAVDSRPLTAEHFPHVEELAKSGNLEAQCIVACALLTGQKIPARNGRTLKVKKDRKQAKALLNQVALESQLRLSA